MTLGDALSILMNIIAGAFFGTISSKILNRIAPGMSTFTGLSIIIIALLTCMIIERLIRMR